MEMKQRSFICAHVAGQIVQAEEALEHVGIWQWMSLIVFRPPILQRAVADVQGRQAFGCLPIWEWCLIQAMSCSDTTQRASAKSSCKYPNL